MLLPILLCLMRVLSWLLAVYAVLGFWYLFLGLVIRKGREDRVERSEYNERIPLLLCTDLSGVQNKRFPNMSSHPKRTIGTRSMGWSL